MVSCSHTSQYYFVLISIMQQILIKVQPILVGSWAWPSSAPACQATFRGFHEGVKDVPMVFQGGFMEVSRWIQRCFKKVSITFLMCFKEVFMCICAYRSYPRWRRAGKTKTVSQLRRWFGELQLLLRFGRFMSQRFSKAFELKQNTILYKKQFAKHKVK